MEMNKVFLTVFTPTYNRRNTLQRCYESLVAQIDRGFIWMIVDDGSTDGTGELVSQWINEKKISIEYHYQENAGKPSATNFSLDNTKTPLWMCLDSDDCLTKDAVRIIGLKVDKVLLEPVCCGIVGPKKLMNQSEKTVGNWTNVINGKTRYISHVELEYQYRVHGDKVYVYRTDKIGNIRYPVFPNEKFIGESYLHEEMAKNYKYYVINEAIYTCEYRLDGLSAQSRKLHVRNPQGYRCIKKQMMYNHKPLIDRFRAAIMYVAACLLCKQKKIIRKSPCKGLTCVAFFPGVFAYLLRYKRLVQEENR